jgi:hypothetical protein
MLALAGCDRVFQLTHVEPGQADLDASTDAEKLRPDGEPMNCPADYTVRLQATASLYKVVTVTGTWSSAEQDCADDMPTGQTHLIVLSNQAEWEALITTPPMYLYDDTWIGASARKSGMLSFEWVTAEATGGFVVPATLGSPPWEPDQPDGAGDCAELRVSGSLHDDDCADKDNYICECDGRPEVPDNF